MSSKLELLTLNGHNYGFWAQDMETLLKIKGLWKYIKYRIPNTKNDQKKFIIDYNKNDVVGVIMTYIS